AATPAALLGPAGHAAHRPGFEVEVGRLLVEVPPEAVVELVHRCCSSGRKWPRRTCNWAIARERRLFTVPGRMWRASAVACSDHPRRWRHTITARWLTDSSPRARATSGSATV